MLRIWTNKIIDCPGEYGVLYPVVNIWHYLVHLKMHAAYGPAVPLLRNYPRETLVHVYQATFGKMFITTSIRLGKARIQLSTVG